MIFILGITLWGFLAADNSETPVSEGTVSAELVAEEAKTFPGMEDIIAILEEMKIPYSLNGEKRIEFSFKGENASFPVIILMETKTNGFLYITIPNLLTVPPDCPNLENIMAALMDLNFRAGFVKYEWNHAASEIRASYMLHTKYYFSKNAFKDMLSELLNSVDLAYPVLLELIDQEG